MELIASINALQVDPVQTLPMTHSRRARESTMLKIRSLATRRLPRSSTYARALALLVAVCMVGCAAERVKSEADELQREGNYAKAIEVLKEGVIAYPDNVPLRSSLISARSAAVSSLTEQAEAASRRNDVINAERLLDQAQGIDPNSERVAAVRAALAVHRSQDAALKRGNELEASGDIDTALNLVDAALVDDRRHIGLLALRRRLLLERRAALSKTPVALAETRLVSLDFRDANVRSVLDVVSRASGLNFVLDKDIRDQHVTVYGRDLHVEDALEMVLTSAQLARKTLDTRSVLIYPNTPEKKRDYEEQLVKVFYLVNGDPKGAAAFLKSMMRLREPYIDEHNNLLSIRESPETIQLAERLISLYDQPEPEVVVDAQILEINADRLTELGIQLPSQITLTPLGTDGTNGSLNLTNFPLRRSNIGVGIGAATITANRTLDDVNTLANPQIRTRSREKARVLIGDKIPIITTTSGGSNAGYISESVSYQDVGIKLEVEPTVFSDDDVAIKLGVEVSALGAQTKSPGGTIAYQISTRDASTVLRLHDGETQLLAGLISSAERASTAGLPGLADVPVLGRLFSDQSNSKSKTELVLSITPHILRGAPQLDGAAGEAWVGTETYQKLKPYGGRYDLAVPVAAPASAAWSAPAPAAKPSIDSGSAATLLWSAPADPIHAGGIVEIPVILTGNASETKSKISVRYPPELLELLDEYGHPKVIQSQVAGAPVDADLIELAGTEHSTESTARTLAILRFKARQPGTASVQLQSSATGPGLRMPTLLTISVLP